MTKLEIYKDKAQSWTKQELMTVRQHAVDKDNFEFIDMLESVLDQRYPDWQNQNHNNHGGGKPHMVMLTSEEKRFENAITAFVWMVNRLFKLHPEVQENIIFESFITKGEHGAVYLAKHPKDLFKNYKTATMNYEQLDNGLFLKKTLGCDQMFNLLARLCNLAKLEFEKDWVFYEIGKVPLNLLDDIFAQLREKTH